MSFKPPSTYAEPTQQSWQRSAKLTEFARLKDSVQRLEKSSREQLALENETQNVFDFMKTELSRVKKSIGALSGVVDEELGALLHECASLREEMGRVVELNKNSGASTLSSARGMSAFLAQRSSLLSHSSTSTDATWLHASTVPPGRVASTHGLKRLS